MSPDERAEVGPGAGDQTDRAGDALTVRGLRVAHGARVVLSGVSFTAARGEVTALLGPNGAGKSTLMKAVLGLVPSTGEMLLGTRALRPLAAYERAAKLAYVPQQSLLEAPLLVRDVVALGRHPHRGASGAGGGRLAHDEATARAIARTGLEPLADRAFTMLSHGERRRVLIARALATEAPVLLLDEPTAALDVGQVIDLLALLRALAAEGRIVIVALHPLHEAAEVADRAVLLSGGGVVASGPTTQVIASGPLREVYGVELVPDALFALRRARPSS